MTTPSTEVDIASLIVPEDGTLPYEGTVHPDNPILLALTPKTDGDVATAVLRYLRTQDHTAGVGALALEVGVAEQQVLSVLDSWLVLDGVPRPVGPGKGGGWLTVDQAASVHTSFADTAVA